MGRRTGHRAEQGFKAAVAGWRFPMPEIRVGRERRLRALPGDPDAVGRLGLEVELVAYFAARWRHGHGEQTGNKCVGLRCRPGAHRGSSAWSNGPGARHEGGLRRCVAPGPEPGGRRLTRMPLLTRCLKAMISLEAFARRRAEGLGPCLDAA